MKTFAVPRPDPFLMLLAGTVAIATLLPVRGQGAVVAQWVTQGAIALLFFMHGAKLSRQAIIAGVGAWRVHLLVLAAGFMLFPAFGVGVRAGLAGHVDPLILSGVLFLTLLPSTVQSSIALTAAANGNVPAAVCSASLSNVAGIFITPVLAAWLLGTSGGGVSASAVGSIALQLLVPFLLGHLSRPLTAGFVSRHGKMLGRLDRGSILLVVYTAFSASVVEGLWQRVGVADLAAILALDALILAFALLATFGAARLFRFARADEIVIVFCGSKKSLASGVPIAGALFAPAMVGPMILPLMLFHQLQLMVCAVIAGRYASRKRAVAPSPTALNPVS